MVAVADLEVREATTAEGAAATTAMVAAVEGEATNRTVVAVVRIDEEVRHFLQVQFPFVWFCHEN